MRKESYVRSYLKEYPQNDDFPLSGLSSILVNIEIGKLDWSDAYNILVRGIKQTKGNLNHLDAFLRPYVK